MSRVFTLPIVLIFINLIFQSDVHAEYFNFSSESFLVYTENIINIRMHYNLVNYTESDFKVRPFIEDSISYIYNDQTATWVNSSELWSSMPILANELVIKIPNPTQKKLKLSFVILNLSTNEKYKTPDKDYWTKNALAYYPKAVNTNILNTVLVHNPKEITLEKNTWISRTPIKKMIKWLNDYF